MNEYLTTNASATIRNNILLKKYFGKYYVKPIFCTPFEKEQKGAANFLPQLRLGT